MPQLADALDRTVTDLGATVDRDAALVEYLRMLAAELDRADAIERAAARLARDVLAEQGEESALYERVRALETQVARRGALDRLGQRYQQGLVELAATRRSAGTAAPPATGTGKLSALRGGLA